MGKYLEKGNRISVFGSIRTGSYEDRNGNKVYTTVLNVDRLDIIDFKGKKERNKEQGKDEFVEIPADDQDLPF